MQQMVDPHLGHLINMEQIKRGFCLWMCKFKRLMLNKAEKMFTQTGKFDERSFWGFRFITNRINIGMSLNAYFCQQDRSIYRSLCFWIRDLFEIHRESASANPVGESAFCKTSKWRLLADKKEFLLYDFCSLGTMNGLRLRGDVTVLEPLSMWQTLRVSASKTLNLRREQQEFTQHGVNLQVAELWFCFAK